MTAYHNVSTRMDLLEATRGLVAAHAAGGIGR